MLDEIASKTVHKDKEVKIDIGKQSTTLSEVKPFKNIRAHSVF